MNNGEVKSQELQVKIEEIIQWIRETVHNAGFSNVIIGLSGGVDSSLSVALATKALGASRVYPVLLPYGNLNALGVKDAKRVIEFLDIPSDNVHIIDIREGVERILNQAQDDKGVSDIRKGNVMARVRMIYLFDLAKKMQALVCGTENKTEHYLGYFTRFGDEASDIEPIRNLYKTEVWEMARGLGLPKEIIEKAPTAGLWEGQTDEKELGFSYQDADRVLQFSIDQGLSVEEIVKRGIEKTIVEQVLDRVAKNAFKHTLPYIFE